MKAIDTATFAADGFGPLEVFRMPGYGEWSFAVAGVCVAAEPKARITALGPRGEFIVTGELTWEWPTLWPDDHDEALDGPKAPTLWSLTVGGIELQLGQEDAPDIDLRRGLWVSVHVTQLTYWTGADDIAPYYREVGARRVIQSIYDHLVRAGCRSMVVGKVGEAPDVWELKVRPQDFDRAREVALPNCG